MRILQVTDAQTWRGGEEQLFLLIQGLQHRYGVDTVVLCPADSPVFQRFQAAGIPVEPFLTHPSWNPLRARHIARRIQALSPDLVVAQTSGAHGLLVFASHLSRTFPPLVVHRRRPSPPSFWSRWKYKTKKVSRYIAISHAVAQTLIRGGVAPDRIVVIPSGIPIPPNPPLTRKELGLPEQSPVIGTVAAFTREKNLFFWLEIFRHVYKEIPETHGLIAGQGYLEPMLMEAIREKGLEGHLRLAPYRPGIIGVFDIFLSTSRIEGLGTAMIQALAYGVPVVAPRVGGIPEVVRHEETGILVETWDVQAFVEALLDLLTHPQRRHAFGEKARQDASRFSIRHTVDRTYQVYREVIGR